jgi:aminomethyltransferase
MTFDIKSVPPRDELDAAVRPADPLRVEVTPLHMKTSVACLTNDWTTRQGYTVPNTCSTLEREMEALTRRAAIADLSPLGKYLVTGEDATRYLDHLLVINVAALGLEAAVISPMCQSSGKVIDIMTVARVAADAWWLTCDGRHMNWLSQAATGFDVHIEDCSATHAGIMLAGPKVSNVLMDADLGDCTDIVLRGARHIVWDNVDITLIHRPGGAVPGLSLLCPACRAGIVWNRLMDGGEAHGLEGVGELAQSALRIDAGIAAAGHDFISDPAALRSDRSRTAIELGFDALVDETKPVFNGRAALLEERARGSNLRLATFKFEGAVPKAGAHLHKKEGRKDVIVGMVTTTSVSPHVAGGRGLGFVVADRVKQGDVLDVFSTEARELMSARQRGRCSVLGVAR